MTETLYNGIELPDAWPPRDMDPAAYEPMPVPYLDDPPAVIPIDVGRQLFVDDFLIERTTLERVFHLPTKHEGNPILKPETPLETEGYLPCATPKDGGVWWDPDAGLFKMWYEAGWLGRLAYATSEDGMHWDRPALDLEPPTNRIVPELTGDSGAVVIDLDTDDPSQRYKLYERESNKAAGGKGAPGYSMVSPDGIHWSEPVAGGPVGDRSTMFYNPFRRRWVYSIRGGGQGIGRARRYREHADFLEGATWADGEAVFWCGADRNDPPDPDIGDPAQLYNLNAVGYESLMLGLFEIHLGPDNKVCQAEARPKITELKTAFSRDGFHWHRPDRRAFIPAARREGVWDRGYVQPVGGICTVRGDELWFYYTGFMGDDRNLARPTGRKGTYVNGSTGIAKLRRDGFASMRAGQEPAELLTRPLTFQGAHLFVNLNNPAGELRVEVVDEQGHPFPGFTHADCLPVATDSAKCPIRWREDDKLDRFAGTPVRFRFHLKQGDLFAFWVSGTERGESGGCLAAGGPDYKSHRDL